MTILRRLLTAEAAASAQPPAFTAAEWLGRPALACRFAERRWVVDYTDALGQPTMRVVTFDEVLEQAGHLYLSGYCHQRFERRHFRLDRITAFRRYDTGEHVAPAGEVARWLGRA